MLNRIFSSHRGKAADAIREAAKAEARREIADHLRHRGEYLADSWPARDLLHATAADIAAGKCEGPTPKAPF